MRPLGNDLDRVSWPPKEILTRSSQIIYNIIRASPLIEPMVLYNEAEIFELRDKLNINDALTRNGMQKLRPFYEPPGVSLRRALNNLWACQMIEKYAKGIYKRSGRPYGIHWLLKTN